MAAKKDVLSTTMDNSTVVFQALKSHTSHPRTDTKTSILTIIRNAYPDLHITEAEQSRISLFEYANAGKATRHLDSEFESFNATRKWKSVGERVEKKLNPGRLTDEYRFARFRYEWEGHEFLIYYVTFKDMLDTEKRIFYVGYPRSDSNIVEGHCVETDKLLLAVGKWTSQLHEEIWVFDDGQWEKSRDLWKAVSGSSWDDVILDQEMKKNLIEDVQGFFDNQALYAQFAVPWKRGIILHGVPGNGKTVSIKALMSSLYERKDQIPSMYVKTFENKCNGEQYSIRQIFLQARASAPCLLIFEDLDSLVGDDVRSYFLNEVDGLESNDGILMIGSTNHLDRLDPAISKRPSRFDRKYHFKLPAEDERTAYANYWRNKLVQNQTVDFPEELSPTIAKLTDGFSFAYLKELFVMALLSLVRGHKGDDFEIVDPEEAAAAKEEEAKAVTTTPDAPAVPEPEVCQCSKTCTDCGKMKEKAVKEAAEASAAAKAAEELAKQSESDVVVVDVPEHLQDNVLLRVVRHQIRILKAEMDNTKEESWPSGKKRVGAGGMSALMMQREMFRRLRR
ncbi:proteasome-activating nucleotidase [Amniculicola lignicola CBS 123094]|uniref:Proteasome-activating nucleotidase n=1 Tax=Amniculicola lignicola CBS 123094 TaxID=1392246 RepID=A0A6A5X0C1_9PLEO|nr:proteasome-activating nucleotidase [Amniculicola lignicola CBS 123094]